MDSSSYFVSHNGQRLGPLSASQIAEMSEGGSLAPDALVWTEAFGRTWKPLAETGILHPSLPPPLPSAASTSLYLYAIVAAPLLWWGIEVVYDRVRPGAELSGWLALAFYLVLNGWLCFRDEASLSASGRMQHGRRIGRYFWLVPVYLALRARATGRGWIWLAVWLVALAAPILSQPDFWQGRMYFGTGVPACDGGVEINQVKAIFDGIAMFKDAGIRAVALTDIVERSASDGSRSCAATIVTSTGPQRAVTYAIDQRGDEFYTRLTVEALQ